MWTRRWWQAFFLVLMISAAFSVQIAKSAQDLSSLQATLLQACQRVESPHQIGYPLDRSEFQLINPYGRPNGRYNGKLHSGDDWIKIDGPSLGESVHAIAPGRVTYSNPFGWGSDKGVVIIEHTLRDGTVFYTLYGHMEESETIKFPARGSCIEKDAIVGVIGDPRPAPHLHFEIRNFDPTTPGPGYWEVDPTLNGWYNPRQFIENQQTWLSDAHAWHILPASQEGLYPPPLLYEDGSLTLISGRYLQSYDANGRLIDQFRLPDSVNPIGLVALNQTQVLLGTADGRVQTWGRFSGYHEQWPTELGVLNAGPFVFGDWLIVQDETQNLHVFDNQQTLKATYPFATISRVAITPNLAAFLAQDGQFLLFDTDGELMRQESLRPNSDIITRPDGGIFLRDEGRIVTIAPDGTRQLLADDLSVNRTDSAFVFDAYHNQLIVWGLQAPARLMALSIPTEAETLSELVWQTDVYLQDATLLSRTRLAQVNRCTVVLASQRGPVMAFNSRNGALQGQIRLWGQFHTNVWLGPHAEDGILRVQIAEQLIGLDLAQFTGDACD